VILLRPKRLPPFFGGFAGFACWPFLVVRADVTDLESLLLHERVHMREQARWLVLPWLALYLLSRRFRLGAELRAYGAQVRAGQITPERAAEALTRYRLGLDREAAMQALNRYLSIG